MLGYNEITKKKFIILDGEPYEVINSHVFRKQQRKPVNQTKLRNLTTGKVTERSFHQSEKVSEADMGKCNYKYLYTKPERGNRPSEYWFSEVDDPGERFTINPNLVPDGFRFIKENEVVEALVFSDTGGERIIGLNLPIKVELEVKKAPPAVKGNTAQGATKEITLETGASVQAPLFINAGDIVEINTETGEYSRRV